jgi:hypothetical protein
MIGVVEKSTTDELKVGLRYWPPDLITGETITAVEATVTPTGLTLSGTATIGGAEVYQKVTGGTAGTEYLLQFKVTTSRPEIFKNPEIDAILVKVV